MDNLYSQLPPPTPGVEVLTHNELRRKTIKFMEDWAKSGKGCAKCGVTNNLTLDHIVPLHFLICLGFDERREFDPHNYQVLCRACNNFKSNRLDFSHPKTKALMLKYLARVPGEPRFVIVKEYENKNQSTANASSEVQECELVEIPTTERGVSDRIETALAGLRERVGNGSNGETGQDPIAADSDIDLEAQVRKAGL